jgi:hypothetical protein
MPWADPQATHNPATGTSPPAAWGDAVRDSLCWVGGDAASGNSKPMCRVYNNADLSIATATFTALTFNSERYDVGGMHSTTTNTSRITIPTSSGGVYHIGASVRFASSTAGTTRLLRLYLNGATYITGSETGPVGGTGDTQLNVSCDYKLTAGDYVEAVVFHNTGGLLSVMTASAYSPEFWCHWVGVG